MSRPDPWKILNLAPTKDIALIEQAWRRLAARHHPDRGGNAEEFRQAREAYEQALKLRSNLITITRTKTPVKVSVNLGASAVLADNPITVQWYDAQNQEHQCELVVPAWQLGWGREHKFVVQDASTNTLLHFNVQLYDDDLRLVQNSLIWSPTVDLTPVIKSRILTATLNNCLHTVDIDDYGTGVLRSVGYLIEKEKRADILVQPRYVWPKKYDVQTQV